VPGVQHGPAVRGALTIAVAGSKLELDLTAPARSARTRKPALLGRSVRHAVGAGRIGFKLALNARGRRALRAKRKLALTLRAIVTAPSGASTTLTHRVTLKR
jgi:hypothetical protein